MRLLVLGLGNVLCEDDGAGVVAVHELLRDWAAPDGVAVLDGGTLGLSLLPLLQDAERVVLVDAVAADEPPGTLVRLEGSDVANAAAHRLSVHQIGVADLLDAARLTGRSPPELVLVGVVPGSMGLGTELTPPVRRAVPALVAATVAEAARLGFPMERR